MARADEIFDDLTDVVARQRRIEQLERQIGELRANQASFRTLVESSPIGIVRCRPDGVLVATNQALADLLGYQIDELLALTVVDITHPDDLLLDAAQIRQLAAGKIESYSVRKRYRHRNGSTVWADLTVSMADRASGEVYGFVKDVTHERELEESMRHSQMMEAIGQLAGGIAHDFNNVLYAIMGNTELALSKLPDDAETVAHLRETLSACFRARDLIQRILTFTRKSDRRLERTDITALVQEVLRLLQATLPATVEISADLDADCPPVLADPVEMHQVVMNLCTNAHQAMPDGKGRLTVSVYGEADRQDGQPRACLLVGDDGIGMPSEVVARCFEPYFTTKDIGHGTGMGLALVHSVVTGVGGIIDVDTAPGRGTTFEIRLPVAGPGDPEEPGHAPGALVSAPRPATIMVVEDEKPIRLLLATVLERLGYEIIAHADGKAARDEFLADPGAVDLLLTDQTMPGLTGIELAAAALAERPDLPVVLCTGHGELVRPSDARALGVREYLTKPLALDRLTGLLHDLVGEASAT